MENNASGLIDLIERFNRKERHILWEQATGSGSRVALSSSYRQKLSDAIGVHVPDKHLVAVDLHLNWLYAALLAHSGKALETAHPIPPAEEGDPDQRRAYEHNQEDIDMLVAFEADATTYVVLIEAKGFTAWSNKQMRSKIRRLDRIVKDAVPPDDVDIRLVLTSFNPPVNLDVPWGRWSGPGRETPPFISLAKPQDRLLVEECDSQGTRKQSGGHVHVLGLTP